LDAGTTAVAIDPAKLLLEMNTTERAPAANVPEVVKLVPETVAVVVEVPDVAI
jgi:hypothetical protein